MARIERNDVDRVAALARLELGDEETAEMVRHLEAILEYVATLEQLDTEGVEPTSHVLPLATPLRPDRAHTDFDAERALANAPARDGFAFAVPKVLQEDEA